MAGDCWGGQRVDCWRGGWRRRRAELPPPTSTPSASCPLTAAHRSTTNNQRSTSQLEELVSQCPLVAGCSLAPKPLPLHISRWAKLRGQSSRQRWLLLSHGWFASFPPQNSTPVPPFSPGNASTHRSQKPEIVSVSLSGSTRCLRDVAAGLLIL